ncbi:universal stress protein [Sulfurospirillum sp. 1612]|uniref:universal stress protein n=1 Tax=Sulfurospirillum sp. 1612 TaxID=3094835 RepID=UPI002F956715
MFENILVPIHLEYKKNHKKLLMGALEVLNKETGKISLFNVDESSAHAGVSPILNQDHDSDYKEEALKLLSEIASEYQLPLERVELIVRHGAVHQQILEQAKDMNADAIVMMATKPSFGSYFISSTAERVIRHAKCSVFVIRLDNL